jgi:hypothetical protein
MQYRRKKTVRLIALKTYTKIIQNEDKFNKNLRHTSNNRNKKKEKRKSNT